MRSPFFWRWAASRRRADKLRQLWDDLDQATNRRLEFERQHPLTAEEGELMPQTGHAGGRQTLDNNVTSRISPPPEAESVPDSDREANASNYRQGYVPDNATNRPAAPPSTMDDNSKNAPSVTYPQGAPNTNRIKSDANTKVGI